MGAVMKEETLSAEIAAVCPINGVSIGRWDDRATWQVDYKPEATPEQRGAAQTVINTFDVLTVEKKEIAADVDTEAERRRLKVITPGSGMALTYQEKLAQARSVADMGRDAANALTESERNSLFPTLSASVGIEAPTLADAADLVIARYQQFAQASMAIERDRLVAKNSIMVASTLEEAQGIYQSYISGGA